ncbi:MAG TPA: protoporphyrinogen oxidase [Candidatus Nanopelagicaceae bacterium]
MRQLFPVERSYMLAFSKVDPPFAVAVVGGGISGLMCARRLSQGGANVTIFEKAPVLGGEIHTATVAGHRIDMGAEAVHLSAPGMKDLLSELGLLEDLVHSNPGKSWLWTARGLRRLPAGVGPSGPRHLKPVLGSGVMSFRGLARAALEPVIPRRALVGDVGVGEFVGRRFGKEVVERFVDPVLGSLHAGNVNKLSLRTITPELAAIADSRSSVMMSRRGQKSGPPMSFATWPGGLSTLVERLLVGTDVIVRTSTEVQSVKTISGGRFRLNLADDTDVEVDAVVLAVPARVAAKLIKGFASNAAEILARIRYATVVTVIVAYPRAAVQAVPALQGTGLLVPSSRRRLLKAATFLTTKWPHLSDANYFLMRLSSGRADEREIENLNDDALIARLHSDLVDATGITAEPSHFHVQRWEEAIPQLEIGHLERIAAAREDLGREPGITLAGASYDGIGITACMRSGERAAQSTLTLIAK